MKKIALFIAGAIMLASCGQYEKTNSGMPYKISGSSKTKFKQGEFVKYNIEYKIKDSVLRSSFGSMPEYLKVDTAHLGKYNFTELLLKCGPGDKVEFSLSVDTLKKLGAIQDYDKVFKRGGEIKGKVEFIKTFATEPLVKADYEAEIQKKREGEIKELEAYAAKNKFETKKTKSGVLVYIEKAGDPALQADSGKQVSVLYKGYLMKDGKVFDSNMDTSAHRPPFDLVINQSAVIPGWHEGLKLFGKGGKGKLLIPSSLAYGPQGQPPVIPPFSNLVFDVEILDVTTPAPQPQQPTMAPPPPTMPRK